MVERLIDPTPHRVANFGKVDDHAEAVETLGGQLNLDARIVSVRMDALAAVFQQPVTVAEEDCLRHCVHGAGRYHTA